jgi:hypothetical protein
MAQPQMEIHPSLFEAEARSKICGYCGEPWDPNVHHTCVGYLNDWYRPGMVWKYGNNAYALIVDNGDTIKYMNIPPGQMREMPIQEFDQGVQENLPPFEQ